MQFARKQMQEGPEAHMLSPHELATLLLLGSDADAVHVDRADLEALFDRQWVVLPAASSEGGRPEITSVGRTLLESIARITWSKRA